MSELFTLADSRDRLLAETTWDRNVVVIAGAGTGKTTILVNRILNLLLREPSPLAITEIVALTFTNKAATEMKQRLRAQLLRLTEQSDELIATFRTRYHLSAEEVGERARMALEQMEKAHIGTLHSFAAHLLRLHPLESEIDPLFQEDDGSQFKELFNSCWDRWLDDELGATGPQHDRWRRVLGGTTLDDLRQFTIALAGDFMDLDELERQCRSLSLEGALRDWVITTHGRAATLLSAQDRPKRRKAEQMLAAALQLLALLLEEGSPGLAHLPQDKRATLEKDLGKAPVGWDEGAFQEAASIIGLAQQLLMVDQSYFQEVVTLVRPFLNQVQSWVSDLRVDCLRWLAGTGQNPLAGPSGTSEPELNRPIGQSWSMSFRIPIRCSTRSFSILVNGLAVTRLRGRTWTWILANCLSWGIPSNRSMPFAELISKPSSEW